MKIPNLKICKTNNYLNLYNKNNNKIILGYYFDIIDVKYKNKNIYLKVNNLNNNFEKDILLLKTIIDIKLGINIKNKKKYYLFIIKDDINSINIYSNKKKINLINFFNIILEKKNLFYIIFNPIIKKKNNNYEFKFIINSITTTNNIFLQNNRTFFDLIENNEIINSPI